MSSRLPRSLIFGYAAIALFMTGDGFELTFLSRFLVDLGYTPVDAALAFSVYGFVAALSAWCSGVIAEMFGARRVMVVAGVAWLVLQVVLLSVGLNSGSLPLILLIYGARAAAYPMFIYSFVVLIAQTVDRSRLATAMGWYWAAYSLGIGVLGTYLPSWLLPVLGEQLTLWLALPWVAAGVLLAAWSARRYGRNRPESPAPKDSAHRLRELARGATILVENRQILILAIVRVICNLTLFGFPVIMPLYLSTTTYDGVGVLDVTQWMQLWGLMFAVTIVTNVLWGRIGDRFGWMRQMRWYGCVGCAVATLSFYYVPQWTGPNMARPVGGRGAAGGVRVRLRSDGRRLPGIGPRPHRRSGVRTQPRRRGVDLPRPGHRDGAAAHRRHRRGLLGLRRPLPDRCRPHLLRPPRPARYHPGVPAHGRPNSRQPPFDHHRYPHHQQTIPPPAVQRRKRLP